MPDCYLTSNCSVEMISNDLYTKFVLPLNARYSAVNLKHESREEIEANVRILYTSGKGEEGHLSISCVGIDSNTPDENVRWFLEACSKYNA